MTAAVPPEIATIQRQLPDRCRAEAAAILSPDEDAVAPLARTMVAPGGVRGDVTASASDLLEAAIWLLAAGDTVESDMVLRRAEAHQVLHTSRLLDMIAHPRAAHNRDLVKRMSGLSMVRQGLKDAKRVTARIEDLLGGAGDDDGVLGRRHLAIGEMVDGPLRAALISGDIARARALALGAEGLRGDEQALLKLAAVDDAELQRTGLLLRAMEPRRQAGEHYQELLVKLPGYSERAYPEALAPRLAGDQEEHLLEDGWVFGLDRWDDPRPLDPAGPDSGPPRVEHGDGVLAQAAGLLRTPRRYERITYGRSRPDLRGRLVRVEATPQAFGEFVREQQGHEAYAGLAISNGENGLELAARMAARSGGDDIEIRCVLPLGTSSRRALATMLADARRHPDWPSELVSGDDAIELVEHQGDGRIERPFYFTAADRRRRPVMSLEQLLGPDDCAHEPGRWVPVGPDRATPDGIALECPRCLRRRVAVLSLASVPAGDPRMPALAERADERTLMERERFYRTLRGLPDTSDSELMDGLAAQTPPSLDPAHWSLRKASGPRPAARPRSMAEAIGRRTRS